MRKFGSITDAVVARVVGPSSFELLASEDEALLVGRGIIPALPVYVARWRRLDGRCLDLHLYK